ncbi:MAG: hypothetical protein EZS28_036323, partial [Streblomastix strix]
MFATKKNAKCKIYYSPTQEDTAAGTGGLQAIWSNKVILLNPPLILMGQAVQKLLTVSNCTAVVIAMDWPNQWWSQQLRNMASNQIMLGNSDRIFKEGHSMKHRKMKLPPGKVILCVTKNWNEDLIFNKLATCKHLEVEQQEALIKEMRLNLRRTRRAAIASLDVYLKSKHKKASSTLKGNAVLKIRRALDTMQQMGKSNQQIIAIRRGICSILALLSINKDFTSLPLISSFMKPIVSTRVKKPKYDKVWKISKQLDFESLKSTDKTQQNVMLHALVLLEAHSTLRGTELASITKDSVTVELDSIK